MAPNPPRYHPIYGDGLEDPERYSPGGFHPIDVKSMIGDSGLRAEYKLGCGGFGTVWLAENTRQIAESVKAWPNLVAVKVLSAEASARDKKELETLSFLRSRGRDAAESKVLQLLHEFVATGPNGQHQCLVLNISGPSVAAWLEEHSRSLPVSLARRAALETTRALAWLHEQGIAHGDLHPGNILLNIKNFHQWTPEQLAETFNPPDGEPLVRADGQPLDDSAPSKAWYPIELASIDLKHIDGSVTLIDFGESFPFDAPPEYLGIPARYAAPEILLEAVVTPAVDIWALACCIFEIRTGRTVAYPQLSPVDDVLKCYVELFGKLPDHLWPRWENRSAWFDEKGEARSDVRYPAEPTSLEEELRSIAEQLPHIELSEAEVLELADLLRPMFDYEPHNRRSAVESLQHSWFSRGEAAGLEA